MAADAGSSGASVYSVSAPAGNRIPVELGVMPVPIAPSLNLLPMPEE